MNSIFNEGVNSSVSRVSGLTGVGGQCRKSCDIANNANPSATRRPNNETALKYNFNGIFESKPRSEGSVASDSTHSPVVSPMVALNHNIQSPTTTTADTLDTESRDEDSHQIRHHSRKGRKRKHKVPEPDKLEALVATKRRIQKSQTTEELAQKYNIDVDLEAKPEEVVNNRFVTTFRTNRKHNKQKVSAVEIDDNTTETKSELLQRFLSSQSSTASPAIQEENDFVDGYSDQRVINSSSAQSSVFPISGHYPYPSVSSEQTSYSAQHSSHHQKTVSNDRVGDEIKDILSHLPPLYESDIVWSDNENENNSSDSDFISVDNKELVHNNHNTDQTLETLSDELETNHNSNNSNNNLINSNSKLKEVTDYEVDKYCEEHWEYVSGTYDSETEWRPWNRMTSAVSYSGDILHILPYVDIDLKLDGDVDVDDSSSQ